MARFTLALLGSPQIGLDEVPIRFDTRKAVALLAYLACTRQAHSREALAALLWPEYADARNALRRTLSAIQHSLGTGWLALDRDQVALATQANVWLDVAAFEAQLGPSASRESLAAGLALYRDDFLSGFTLRDSPAFDEWQYFEAERLRQQCANALERLAELHSQAGDLEEAIAAARRRLALDPLHEPAHRALMRYYAAAGQRAAALRQYRACAQRLEQELGIAPAEETAQLYTALRVAPAAPASPGAPVSPLPAAAASSAPASPLVGRDAERARLRALYATAHHGALAAITGSPGIGKTHLAEDLLAAIHGAGGVTLTARCYEGEASLAYAPIAAVLREATKALERAGRLGVLSQRQRSEVGRLVPRLAGDADQANAPPLVGPDARRRFFEAVSDTLLAAIAGPVPGVLLVDDVHWADGASLDLLAFLARRLRGQAGLLLLTWRDEEVPSGHSLRALLAEARRAGPADILALTPLSAVAVEQLVRACDTPLDPALASRLYAESEGVPFLVVEYLAALRERALPPTSEAPWPLPDRARELLEARLSPLSELARGLLSAGATVGRAFDMPTLCAAAAVAEEIAVDGVEELLARGLIAEVTVAPLRYAFGHERLRSLVYEGLSQARRRLFHHRVATHLATLLSDAARPGLAAHIAHHAAAAGETMLAAVQHRLAGDEARALAANAEAATHYAAALAAGHPETATLHEALGDLRTLAGDYADALAHYAAARASAGSGPALARKIGELHHRLGEWETAEAEFAAALADAGVHPAERARALAAWSLTARRRGDLARAAQYADEALAIAEAAADPRALARAYGAAGAIAALESDHVRAQAHLERGLALAEQVDDPETRVAALNSLALALGEADRPRAIALAEAALALCLAHDDRHRAAALHNTLADLRHAGGEREAARAHLREAVILFAAIGHDQPAIWMLTEW
jgi:DNA-binding SARP family transcriptional activator